MFGERLSPAKASRSTRSALIGATDARGSLRLLAPVIENRDDTTATDSTSTTAIFGMGDVVLAGG